MPATACASGRPARALRYYEKQGIAFSDVDEIWWLETIGGHHWIAKRVPDDAYVTMPNQLGIDSFDLDDAEGAQADQCAPPTCAPGWPSGIWT
ncbi:MAG: C69 family dipeptidase [Collinsella sp.]